MSATATSSEARRIQPLPTHLANQIAAGEVVERPSSVVKELVENSIDAAARHIELEIEQGGVKLIRVLDDGSGIHAADLPLAIAPHATSKVYSQQELQRVLSLGFRGEALASIASVSRFSIASRQQGEGQGLKLETAEKGVEALPCAMSPGTRIEARDLFYNTPARRKFLRTERTEYLHIEEVVRRLALSRFDVGFKLLHNGRQQFNLSPIGREEQRSQRVAALLGKSFLQHALGLEFEAAGMRLWGWVGEPGYSRSQADVQYFYLNGRVIRDKLVSHALRQAHQSLLPPGRHPAYLLYLELDPQLVDINVHPTKHEVRFRESRLVHDFLARALRNTFDGRGEALPLESATVEVVPQAAMSSERVAEQHAPYRGELRPTTATVLPATSVTVAVGRSAPAPLASRVLSVVHGRYLLVEGRGELEVVAVTAARELLLQSRLAEALETGELQSQPLLIPATVTLAEGEIARLEGSATTLLRLGVVLERLGESSVVLRQLPLLLRGVEPAPFVVALCEFLATAPELETESQRYLQQFASSLAPLLPAPDIRGGEQLLRELEQLLRQGGISEASLPWRTLDEAQLAALFAG